MDYYFHRRTAESVLMISLIAVHALSVLQSVVPAQKHDTVLFILQMSQCGNCTTQRQKSMF